MRTNIYRVLLRGLSTGTAGNNLERTLQTLDQAIDGCLSNLADAGASGESDYLDVVQDEEGGMVDALLGAALVCCQTEITGVVSRVLGIRKYMASKGANPIMAFASKRDIISFGGSHIGTSGFTGAQVLDSCANYFKHHEEWPADWDVNTHLSDQTKRTVSVVQAVGMRSGSTTNLKSAAAALGNGQLNKTTMFVDVLRSWRGSVHRECERQLQTAGCL